MKYIGKMRNKQNYNQITKLTTQKPQKSKPTMQKPTQISLGRRRILINK